MGGMDKLVCPCLKKMDFIKRKLKFITDQLNILEPYREKTIQDIRKDYNVYLIWSKRNIKDKMLG